MAALNVVVVTPEKTLLDEKAESVSLQMFDGEMGIFPGHSPMIGRLGYGELRMDTGQQVLRFYVDGGFVQVDDDIVSVLTDRAVEASDIDVSAAEKAVQEAIKTPAAGDAAIEDRDRQVAQARAQIRTAKR